MRSEKEPFDLLPPPFSLCSEQDPKAISTFQHIIYDYYTDHERAFPWRESCDPYHILLSEMMLQQTQTHRVLPFYEKFLSTWPTFKEMSEASLTDILSLWKGLGYNRRALALKKIALAAVEKYAGTLPDDQKLLMELPMIGPATSAAVLAFAYRRPALYLETNIRRVLLYFFFDGVEGVKDRQLYELLERVLDPEDPKNWYYAFMDYGVFLKRKVPNPNRRSAHYTKQGKFENSNRQIRGELLTIFTQQGALSIDTIVNSLSFPCERIQCCIDALEREGFITSEASVAEEAPVYQIR